MILFMILIVYILVGIIIETKFSFSDRFWLLYVWLLVVISIMTVIDWLSIVF